jgi:lipoprotein-anchoring transpeptidase ErfK/SrfK
LTFYLIPIIFVSMAGKPGRVMNRRDFLKNSLLGAGAVALQPWLKWDHMLADWPDAEKLGRNCSGGWINLRSKPSPYSEQLSVLYEDAVFVWLREVVGEPASYSRRWIETPEGYLYAPSVQPVQNKPNPVLESMPDTSEGRGMWVEVTVPYVDLYIANPPARSPWAQEVQYPRLYYSQVIWVDDFKIGSQGQPLYRVNEKYGSYGDIFWAEAEAFRPLTEEEISPINPDATDKRIEVNLNYQTLSCYEGNSEVYFCRVSTGAMFNADGVAVDEWATPPGLHQPWRKSVSIHMSGGSTGAGWDTMGVPWSIFFDPDGAAIHSTFWHNDFGTPRSHGCVNASPDDAKWIFRWASPKVLLHPGDLDLTGVGGTLVNVVHA